MAQQVNPPSFIKELAARVGALEDLVMKQQDRFVRLEALETLVMRQKPLLDKMETLHKKLQPLKLHKEFPALKNRVTNNSDTTSGIFDIYDVLSAHVEMNQKDIHRLDENTNNFGKSLKDAAAAMERDDMERDAALKEMVSAIALAATSLVGGLGTMPHNGPN